MTAFVLRISDVSSDVCSSDLPLTLIFLSRQAETPRIAFEQGSTMFLGHPVGRRGDAHPAEVGSGKSAAGDLRRREQDMPNGCAVRRKSHDALAAHASDPQAALRTQGTSVGTDHNLFNNDECRRS